MTLVAVFIGAGIGSVSSVPVTNKLLENQVASQVSQSEQIEQNFGRGSMPAGNSSTKGGKGNFFTDTLGTNNENSYVTEIRSAMNLTVADARHRCFADADFRYGLHSICHAL